MVAQIDKEYITHRPSRLWSRLLAYGGFEGRPLTTRGQWINPVIFGLFRVWRALPQLRKAEAPVFILSTGRSGTTVLGIVLSMHKDVGFLNEPKALWASVHPEEDIIGSYQRGAAHYRLPAQDATATRARGLRRVYGAYLALSGNRRVVDKYPELVFRMPFVRALFPQAKFLFLVRDGWDTCASVTGWSDRLGDETAGEVHDWWGVNSRKWTLLVDQVAPEHPDFAAHVDEMRGWTRHEDRAAAEWILTMREGIQAAKDHPDAVLMVPYEAACEDPTEWMSRITAFCDLREDPHFVAYAAQKLAAAPPKDPFDLHPILQGPFEALMADLGYRSAAT